MSEPEHLRITYNEVHNLIRETAKKIADFKPDVLIAIGENHCFLLSCPGYIPVHFWGSAVY